MALWIQRICFCFLDTTIIWNNSKYKDDVACILFCFWYVIINIGTLIFITWFSDCSFSSPRATRCWTKESEEVHVTNNDSRCHAPQYCYSPHLNSQRSERRQKQEWPRTEPSWHVLLGKRDLEIFHTEQPSQTLVCIIFVNSVESGVTCLYRLLKQYQ